MTTSVVMATYNGSKYLEEQLESLRIQTQPIDEVLIFDDCSSDNTVLIAEQFIRKYSLNGWKVFRNEKNKGYRLNFLEGALLATKEVIFYCDQDDIWEKNKVEKIAECFRNPDVMVCGHEEVWFNQNGSDDYKILNRRRGGGTKEI